MMNRVEVPSRTRESGKEGGRNPGTDAGSEKIAELEEKLRLLTEYSLVGIYLMKPGGEIIYANRRMVEISGYSLSELEGLNIFNLIHSDDRERIIKQVSQKFSERPPPRGWTCRAIHQDGSVGWLEGNSIWITHDGQPALLGSFLEVTESKNSEHHLCRLTQLEMAGTLSLSIAHEFNNILMGISGSAELAAGEPDNSPLIKNTLSTIILLSQRAAVMIKRLGAFGRREQTNLRPTEVTVLLDEALDLHQRDLKLAEIKVEKSYPGPVRVMADPSQLEQVFVNLFLNAYHALLPAGKGTISVEVSGRKRELEISISDDGIGIPEDQLPQIFEPFFTTKADGKENRFSGLGLGLWVSRQIVEEHGGRIEVARRPGGGTVFTLTLPRILRSASASAGNSQGTGWPV